MIERNEDKLERLEKRREERFVKSMTDAHDTLYYVIWRAENGNSRAFGSLEDFGEQTDGICRQSKRLEVE